MLLRPDIGQMPQVRILPPLASILLIFRGLERLGDIKFWKENISRQFISLKLVDQCLDVFNCIRQIRKQLLHCILRLVVEFIVWKTKPIFSPPLAYIFLRLADVLRIPHTKQNVLGFVLFGIYIIRVVCRQILDIVLRAHPQ